MINLEDMSVSELQKLIADAKTLLDKALEEKRRRDWHTRRMKSASSALRKRELEKAGEKLFEQIKVGSIVRVDGVRDLSYKYREVTHIGRSQFAGRQVKFDRDGNIVYGAEYTTHMANKIREIRQ